MTFENTGQPPSRGPKNEAKPTPEKPQDRRPSEGGHCLGFPDFCSLGQGTFQYEGALGGLPVLSTARMATLV